MRNLVKRYVAAMIRDAKTEEGLTEENFKVTIFILVLKTPKEHATRNTIFEIKAGSSAVCSNKTVCLLIFKLKPY